MSDHVLGTPTLRISELDENSSRYDKMLAAPSDDELHKMWIGWSVAFFVTSSFNLLVFLSVVFTRRLRKSPFNKYLIGVSTRYKPIMIHDPFSKHHGQGLADPDLEKHMKTNPVFTTEYDT